MDTTLAPSLSVTSDGGTTDVTLTVIFSPCQPLGATTVIVVPDPGADHAGLLALLEAATQRLALYRADYAEALAVDVDSLAARACT